MKKAILIHNPTAGSGDHGKKSLIKTIESAGYEVKYYSTHTPGWERFVDHEANAIFLAGGDGTVQKLAAELRKAGDPVQKIPVQILPLGTANNIATTLDLRIPLEKLIKLEQSVGFDAGKVQGAGDAGFFIEGIGFGIFPRLVKDMEEKEEPEDPEEELKQSLQELLKIVKNYEAREAIIIADAEEITGRFLLIELMNIRFIGPNFELAPNAKTNDGNFELVAIPEEARKELEDYIYNLLGKEKNVPLENFALLKKVKKIRLKWFGEDMHVDDQRIDYNGGEVTVKNLNNIFNFRAGKL